jgi:hypothetical protein
MPLFGGHNFLNYILFLTIFNASNVPIEGVQVLFGHKKTTKPSPWEHLNVQSLTNLPYIICLANLSHDNLLIICPFITSLLSHTPI